MMNDRVKRAVAAFGCAKNLVMAALCHRAGHYIFALQFLSIFFYLLSFFLSSPNLSGRRLDVYHTLTHGVECEFRMQV